MNWPLIAILACLAMSLTLNAIVLRRSIVARRRRIADAQKRLDRKRLKEGWTPSMFHRVRILIPPPPPTFRAPP